MEKHHFLRILERMARENEGAPRADVFIAAASIFISVALVAGTTDFKTALGLPPEFWRAFWFLVGVVSLVISVVQGTRLVAYRTRHTPQTPEQVYEAVLVEQAADWRRLEQIEKRVEEKAQQPG